MQLQLIEEIFTQRYHIQDDSGNYNDLDTNVVDYLKNIVHMCGKHMSTELGGSIYISHETYDNLMRQEYAIIRPNGTMLEKPLNVTIATPKGFFKVFSLPSLKEGLAAIVEITFPWVS